LTETVEKPVARSIASSLFLIFA